MSGAGSVNTNVENICDQVHALNESLQKQLEEINKKYIELQEQQEKEKEQWS